MTEQMYFHGKPESYWLELDQHAKEQGHDILFHRLEFDNSALRTRLDVAVKALEWYGNAGHYEEIRRSTTYGATAGDADVITDNGNYARQALREINEQVH
jgi:hypothetical protein